MAQPVEQFVPVGRSQDGIQRVIRMLLRRLLDQRSGEVKVFQRSIRQPGFADTLARTLIAPAEIPLGIITSLLGAPKVKGTLTWPCTGLPATSFTSTDSFALSLGRYSSLSEATVQESLLVPSSTFSSMHPIR